VGGKAKEPKMPPPPPAPVRADMAQGEQALMAAGRRQGLRSTITPQSAMLGAQTALGAGTGPIATPKISAPIQGYAKPRPAALTAMDKVRGKISAFTQETAQ
jgi:hypothetical protein